MSKNKNENPQTQLLRHPTFLLWSKTLKTLLYVFFPSCLILEVFPVNINRHPGYTNQVLFGMSNKPYSTRLIKNKKSSKKVNENNGINR